MVTSPPDSQPEEIPWTEEALRRVENAPSFVRPGIRKLVPQRARALGQPIITSEFLTQIRNESMLRVAKSIKHFGFEEFTVDAFTVARQKMQRHPQKLEILGQIENFLAQRTSQNAEIIGKFKHYFDLVSTSGMPWTPEALERLERLPVFVRGMVKQAVEEQAKTHKEKVVTPQLFSMAMQTLLSEADLPSAAADGPPMDVTLPWEPEPLQRLQRIPIVAIRQRVKQRVENYCQAQGANRVSAEHFNQVARHLTD